MLTRIKFKRFKTLSDVDVKLPRLTVLFGPNSAGKSNFIDALQTLSRVTTERTIKDALGHGVRGYPLELFEFPPGGLPELIEQDLASFEAEADIQPENKNQARSLKYRIKIQIQPKSGILSVRDEYLTRLNQRGSPTGNATIENKENTLLIRIKGKGSPPRKEDIGQNHTIISDTSYSGERYPLIETIRHEMSSWHTYYLDPRVAMRAACPPTEVTDIGTLGETIAAFLYRLNHEHPKSFEALKRALKSIIPSVENIVVDLDKKRGEVDIWISQDGVPYPIRVISEGTLRVLALCALCVNPWKPSFIAFEEPENGVHPRRLELIVELLVSLSVRGKRQLIVTSHSPRFCDMMLNHQEEYADEIALMTVRREGKSTSIRPFQSTGSLYQDTEIKKALSSPREDGIFEALSDRGWIDE